MSEPFTAFNFRVEITLPGTRAPLCEAAFAECDGMEMSFDVKSVREGGDNAAGRLLAGPASYGHVTLKRGMTRSFDLWDWCAAVQRDPGLRADARIVVLASDGRTENARFLLRRCLPVRLKAPPLDAAGGGVAVEELQLACESLALERPGEPAPEPPRLRRAELRELDERSGKEINKDRWVEVQLNPRDLRLSVTNPDGEAPVAPRLGLDLWFDAAGAEDVRRHTERVAYFATPRTAGDRKTALPPHVRFAWGELRFDGRVESMVESLDFFAPDGRALRAALALTLRGSAQRA